MEIRASEDLARHFLLLLAWCTADSAKNPRSTLRIDSLGPVEISELARRKVDSLHFLATGADSPQQDLYQAIWNQQRTALIEIITKLNQLDINTIVFKGAEVFEYAFSSQPINITFDLDLLVQPKDIERARIALYQLGYRQARFPVGQSELMPRDFHEIVRFEANHYELAGFARLDTLELAKSQECMLTGQILHTARLVGGRPVVMIQVDLHHGLAIDVSSDPFWDGAVDSSFGCGNTLNIADHVWFLASRYYAEVGQHGKPHWRELAYIAALLSCNPFDWDRIFRLTYEYPTTLPAIFYIVALIEMAAGPIVPPQVFKSLDLRTADRKKDAGWLLGRIFDLVEPFPFPYLCRSTARPKA